MNKQRTTLIILIVLGFVYFGLMIWPNYTRARDPSMISIFEPDEGAQYPHVMRMVTPGDNWEKTLKNFFFYQHYYYGFPFYFSSAVLALLPVKLLVGIGGTAHNLLAMRQMVSVLPMILASATLVYAQTRFKNILASIAIFIFLLTVPAVFANSTWWHPDSLTIFFIALTFLFLDLDDLRFGKYFYLSAVSCGLATGTKLIGLFFFLAIPIYLLIGIYQKKLSLKNAAMRALAFLGIMLVTAVIVNPFLLAPSQRLQAYRIQSRQAAAMSVGWNVRYGHGLLSWLTMIQTYYGYVLMLGLTFGAVALNIWMDYKRVLNILILAFVIPFLFYIFSSIVIKPTHFLLPAALPLYSCLAGLFYVLDRSKLDYISLRSPRRLVPMLISIVVIVLVAGNQIIYNFKWDASHYVRTINEEKESQEIQFYNELKRDYLSRIPGDQPRMAFRDVRIYFPDIPPWSVTTRTKMATYPIIQEGNFDLVAIWNQRALDYTNEGTLENAIDPVEMEQAQRLYQDVLDGNLDGYQLLYRTECCSAFLLKETYYQYFRQ